jgi:hypothetical protein
VKLQVAVEEFNKVDLRESLECILIATKTPTFIHHKVHHIAGALQHRSDGCLAPLDTTYSELCLRWTYPILHRGTSERGARGPPYQRTRIQGVSGR